jgi:hypothetical protein
LTDTLFSTETLRRTGGAGLVLLLHLIMIAFLLRATLHAVQHISTAHEETIWFVPPPRVKPQTVRVVPAPAAPPHSTRFVIPRNTITPAPMVPNITEHGDLHALLFDCAPENLANLPPQQRARCLSAPGSTKPPSDTEVYAEHATRSHEAARWARGVARKHEPLLLPCMPPGLGTLLCLAKAAKDGKFDLDELPSYGDKPEDIQTPNGGDPPTHPPG